MDLTLQRFHKLIKEQGLFRVHKELESEIVGYSSLLHKSSRVVTEPIRSCFEIPIYTGVAHESYDLTWNIEACQRYIENECLSDSEFEINHPLIWSDPKKLNIQKLNSMLDSPKISKPIIFALHTPIEKLIVIDGNHRYHVAKHRQERKINSIILPPETHTRFLINEYQRNLFLIHHNLVVLGKYSHTPSIKYDINASLNPNTFYPLSPKKYDSSWFRHTCFRFLKFAIIHNSRRN